VQLLTSYMNFLRVKKVVCKPGEDNNIENVTIQGSITALDDIDLTATGLIIYWGAEPCEIAKEEFTKKNSKYIAKVPSSDTDPFSANISIDFTKCEFKIVLKKTSIPYQASPVWFGLECGSFVLDVEVAFKE